ncbi:N-acetylmuramoyl-L-alanine amidase family protein, partial [Bacillus sp. FJAT-28004]|uniref:peptidoglycan recognition protein family protein n=1 Tax=Bacillus sp. FJAT-28004 TaxID=1679165 RepID=UPI000AFEA644
MVNYTIDHIPKGTAKNRRPALFMTATSITIHNTGNPKSSAENERAWLTNPSNSRTASYHIVVDEREAIECLPLNENAWHSGDGAGSKSGNRTSIGIEICESGDYAKTLANAVELVASMLNARGWGVDKLRRHYDWSGKVCPRLMHNNGSWSGWI